MAMKTIKRGYRGEEVETLGSLLSKYGYSIQRTDTFNEEIYNAVVGFQKNYNLGADGIVGYYTWEALFFGNRHDGLDLTEEDFTKAAKLLDVDVAALKAVKEVETGGKGGFLPSGKPVILFEGHIFWSQLKKMGINPEQYAKGNEDILYPKWEKSHYKGGEGEYERLDRARKISWKAADCSASWGMFQVMGFNYSSCGESDIESFVDMMSKSELHQLLLSIRFIRSGGMLPALQRRDWANFAKLYNGPSYKQNKYDEKLEKAYQNYA